MDLGDKIGTWVGYVIGGILFVAIFIGLKFVLKIGVIAWLNSMGIPTWVAIIMSLILVGFVFHGLSHFFDKNETNFDEWVDRKEAEYEAKKAKKREAKANKKSAKK